MTFSSQADQINIGSKLLLPAARLIGHSSVTVVLLEWLMVNSDGVRVHLNAINGKKNYTRLDIVEPCYL